MLSFKEEPPSTKALKQYFIDGNYQNYPGDMLDCVAHMVLAIENPKETVRVALSYMGNHLSACRADAGFAAPTDTVYTPLSEYCNEATRPHRLKNLSYQINMMCCKECGAVEHQLNMKMSPPIQCLMR